MDLVALGLTFALGACSGALLTIAAMASQRRRELQEDIERYDRMWASQHPRTNPSSDIPFGEPEKLIKGI